MYTSIRIALIPVYNSHDNHTNYVDVLLSGSMEHVALLAMQIVNVSVKTNIIDVYAHKAILVLVAAPNHM